MRYLTMVIFVLFSMGVAAKSNKPSSHLFNLKQCEELLKQYSNTYNGGSVQKSLSIKKNIVKNCIVVVKPTPVKKGKYERRHHN